MPVNAEIARYSDIEPVVLLAITARQYAVILKPDRQLITLAIDDELGESGAKIVEILADRIVLQQQALADNDPSRLIWLYLAESPDQSSRIVTLDRLPPQQPFVLHPAMTTSVHQPAVDHRY